MCWVYIDKISYSAKIWDFGNDEGNYMSLSASQGSNGIPAFNARINYGEAQYISLPQAIPIRQWIHTTVAFNESHVSLYFNWKLVGSRSLTFRPSDFRKATRNWIGRSQHWIDAGFFGSIIDFYIYERALTLDQILKISKGI